MAERLTFQADISELMNLIVHAFYSNRDVFLREIVSNASDALDKQRHNDLQQNILNECYRIRLSTNENQLIVEDTGIGMSREDLVDNLSTIARSGTKQFIKSLQEKSDQIGQFGVGFYSVFLVASFVEVYTQKKGCPIYKWTSDAQDYYTLESVSEGEFEAGHGTRIVLTLKDDAKEYLEHATVRRIISTHSSFITYPIELWVTREVEVKTEEGKNEEEIVEDEGDSDQNVVVEDENTEENVVVEDEAVEKEPPKKETIQEWETINGDKPVWSLSPSDVSEEAYHTLYKTLSHDYETPLFYRHFQTEGAFEFRGILFIPQRAPFDVLGERNREKRRIRLYVKKVLVLNELDKEMLPDWMNFVVGVIDSPDLPLNVSREMLQQTKVLQAMKSQLKKQILTMVTSLLEDHPEKYTTFYDGFQRNIKLGIHEGDETLLRFLRLELVDGSTVTLDDYIEKCQEGQKSIYYATGPEAGKNILSQLYTDKGYNVILFKEPIDEFVLQRVNKYKEYDLVNISKEHQVPWAAEIENKDSEDFCKWVQEKLGDSTVEKVRVSVSLTEPTHSACCVVSSKFGWTGNMEKIMMAQPLTDPKTMMWMKGKKIWELNWNHPVVRRCHEIFSETPDTTDENLVKKIRLLYQSSLLSAGYPIEGSAEFINHVVECLSV